MKRICIIGCPGVGKSTFSRELAKLSDLPLIHLDQLFWEPGWVESDKDVFRKKLEAFAKEPEWIIDGNYHNHMECRFKNADIIFWIDYPTWRCLYGVIRRVISFYGKTRADSAAGCPERLDWKFLLYVSKCHSKYRPKMLKAIEEFGQNCKIIVFKKPSDIKAWLENYGRDR